MTIPKLTSKDFNNILENSQHKIKESSSVISEIKTKAEIMINIINHEIDYASMAISNANITDGVFDRYKNMAHPKLKSIPFNIFNIDSVNLNEPYFKDDTVVRVNGIENTNFNNIIKSNAFKNKRTYFEEFPDTVEEITIELEADRSKTIGVNMFNIIEFNPLLQGSFDITKIEIFNDDNTVPTSIISGIESVGKTRIILDKKYAFKKVKLYIKPNYRVNKNGKNIIPFGIDTLFLLDGNFRTDSYFIIKYTSDRYIDSVSDNIKFISSTTEFETSLTDIDAQIYLDYNDGILESPQEPSRNSKKTISRNVKTIYLKIPIGTYLSGDSIDKNTFVAMKLTTSKR